MKGFRFRLEPVLTLRRHREETLQVQLAESQRAMDAEVARREAIKFELGRHVERMARQQARGPLDVDGLNRDSAYQVALEQRLARQAEVIARLARQVAEDREAVLKASRDKKAMEKLREALLVAFAREEARKEQKAAEETATSRHVRRQQGREFV